MGQRQSTPNGSTAESTNWSQATSMAIAAFTAVAWYNVAELNTQVFLTFKRRRGLYFWSLIISSYGFLISDNHNARLVPYGDWTGCRSVLSAAFSGSRTAYPYRILTMIIVDALVFHIPTTILTYLSNTKSTPNGRVLAAFNVYEKLQMTAFCIQEFIISGVYVWATISLLRPVYHGRTRKVMTQLIWINLIIIVMDFVLLAMEYSNIYEIEATLKSAVYSIKLKLEFAVLNQLMSLANSSVNNHQNLHIDEANGKKEKPIPGRSKSTEYISNRYRKPKKRPDRPPGTALGMEKSNSSSHVEQRCAAPYPLHQHHRRQDAADIDRIEFQGADKPLPEIKPDNDRRSVDPVTNPAAFYERGRRRSPVDMYTRRGDLEDIEDSPIISPTLSGATLDDVAHQQTRRGRRAAPPPNLELGRQVMPSGLIQSTRPSVSDWAHGPDSGESPCTDELQLEPFDSLTPPLRSPGSVRHGREMANRSMGDLNFMTSALKKE